MSAFKFYNVTTGMAVDLQDALTLYPDNLLYNALETAPSSSQTGITNGTIIGLASGVAFKQAAGGRLTVLSGTPVNTTDSAGNGTIYYTQYKSSILPIRTNAGFLNFSSGEISVALTDTTLSPAAAGNNLIYDMFASIQNNAVALSRGPDWTQGGGSTTGRGAGAGSTQLQVLSGLWVNQNDIKNLAGTTVIPATHGTYLGTIMTNSTATVDWQRIQAGTGANTLATLGVWNYFNRIAFKAVSSNTTNGYTYASTTVREENGNTGNAKIQFVTGFAEDPLVIFLNKELQGNATGPTRAYFGVGLDVTNSMNVGILSTDSGAGPGGSAAARCTAWISDPVQGSHYLSMLEKCESANTCTFYSDLVHLAMLWC